VRRVLWEPNSDRRPGLAYVPADNLVFVPANVSVVDAAAVPTSAMVIDGTRPLDEAADARRYFGAGHTRGKVVVTVRRPDRRGRPNPCVCTPRPAAAAAGGTLPSKKCR
jgi:hypothetical protein